ncbi:MAG: hypothetical protein DCO96_09390 [Fluviicola sp. XM-24bin1]|nr:MAG: hypothetical protein DCO96_09390 [Fluviicola sp. XM-24bin1]
MKPIVRNIIAVVLGLIVGNVVNMGLVQVGYSVFTPDVDVNDMKALAKFMEEADMKYFIFPFIAHALGTLAGAFTAALFSKNQKMGVALIIGGLFFIGGIMVSFLIPAPMWFIAMDLVVAYIPMALLGAVMAKSLFKKRR